MADPPSDASLISDALKVAAALFGFLSAYLAWLSATRKRLITRLEDEIAELKKSVQRYTSRVDPESDRKLIKTAKRSVQVLGVNSLRVLHHSREDLLSFLKRGRRLQILLLDPRKPAFQRRARLEEDRVGRIIAEWNASVKILMGIEEKLAGSGQIEVRLYDENPDRSLVIVDGIDRLTDDTSILINYYPEGPGIRGYEGVQFLAQQRIPRDRDSLEKNLQHFAALWARSEPIDVRALGDLESDLLTPHGSGCA